MLGKASIVAAAVSMVAMTIPAVASADATDDYPIPNRILKTTCTVDQYMAATRDTDLVLADGRRAREQWEPEHRRETRSEIGRASCRERV